MNRPDFSKLYSRMYDAGMATGKGWTVLAYHVIAAECDGFMSQRLLPQRAASRQQEFGYISEDDGQYHTTRRIDWDYLLG